MIGKLGNVFCASLPKLKYNDAFQLQLSISLGKTRSCSIMCEEDYFLCNNFFPENEYLDLWKLFISSITMTSFGIEEGNQFSLYDKTNKQMQRQG